ncbi:MAG: hypothetical protein ACK6AT_11050 [Planctomycetota bacterium]|jgi:hypothetical protein
MSLLQILAEIKGLENSQDFNSIKVLTDINPRLEKGVAKLSKEPIVDSVSVEVREGSYIVRGHKNGETKLNDREKLVEMLTEWANQKTEESNSDSQGK